MTYQPGDYVFPADLPHRFLCRVVNAEPIANASQFLSLEPLEGPWPNNTLLFRLDGAVVLLCRPSRPGATNPPLVTESIAAAA